uniref:Multiple epidermal growth factor-like domains protein 10 isoform X2 n=1 Tax=Crassostrea virginica TaxID=6565 RepID=A0A8B8BTD6_CRAVI|nr:multiple epidermal growth factor-like domains protein 10 isoform X2 [Crassostrea virginica]
MELMNLIIVLKGFILAFGYDDLSKDKVATQSTTFPPPPHDANKNIAGNAVDRHITTCMSTELIGPNSPDQTVWWKVDLGGVYNIYSVNIMFKNYPGYESRQQGRLAGFSIFVSTDGTRDDSSLCYKDGPQLPALNFTTTCITSGRYVIFYNERLRDVAYPNGYEVNTVYTELCEVTVHGCQASGVYGDSCTEPCPPNCRENVCHIQKGTCYGCVPGWINTTCNTKCVGGWYGLDCKQQCSGHCRDNIPCNHDSGQCDGGCAAGWRGVFCDKVCEDGTYGNNCVHNCSGNCLDDSPCNRQTGHCEGGCKPGYTNAFCNKNCQPGYYGYRCENVCSGHCLNNTNCDYINGKCCSGCQPGYIGKLCNDSCKNGYYGQNCSRVCSSKCKTCKPTDGTCSCSAGWMGPNCSIACDKSYGENCQNPCSPFCINQTCDSLNGTCLTSCIREYFNEKCSSEKKADHLKIESNVTPVAVLWTLSALVVLIIVVATLLIRRKWLNKSSTSSSPYAEINVRQNEDSTYQQLNVSISGARPDNTYQNLSLQ